LTWIENAASLDGATNAVLREMYQALVADEAARQPGDYLPCNIPRFRYFLKVYQEVLESLASSDDSGEFWTWMGGKGFVKLVDGN
jgi:hypothetical protein